MISQKDRNQSKELVGISASSVGAKRNADALESSAGPFASGSLIPKTGVWRKEPTRILPPDASPPSLNGVYGSGRAGISRPRAVNNPFGRMSGGKSSEWSNGRGRTTNPTARNTITDYQTASKRQKTGQNGYKNTNTSKYYDAMGGSKGPLPINDKWVSHYTFDPVHDHSQEVTQAIRQKSSSPPPNKPVIDVDSFDPNEEDEGKSAQRETYSADADEIDFFNVARSADVPPKLPIERHAISLSLANSRKVSEPDARHPFRQGGQSLRKPLSRCIAEDGASTSRIRAQRNINKCRAPTELPTNDSVDEIEDPDSFPGSASTSSTRTISNRHGVHEEMTKKPWESEIKHHGVQELTKHFEHKAKSRELPHLDLFVHGVKNKMKGKKNTKTQEFKIEKPQPRHNGTPRRDKLATEVTKFEKAPVVVPLELCIWGKVMYQLPENAVDPKYWLLWNNRDSQLQLCLQPDGVTKGVQKSLPLKQLDIQEVIVACDQKLSVIISLNQRPGLPDDLASIGLVFKVMDKDLNSPVLEDFIGLLKEQARYKSWIEVAPPASTARLEEALKRYEIYMSQDKEIPAEASDASLATSSGSEVGKPTQAVRPRVAYGGKTVNEALMPSRRSSRLSSGLLERQATPVNMDEIILVYPPSGSGAVNVTNGDLRRLEPSEFLNDTLIELGLKLWLNDLRARQPELAEEIHVFSSFFYKKLNHKSFAEGYTSLRKWTAKVDIFKKKYIIIPINENVHWYLAIIYHPEHILDPPAMKSALRTSKRTSNAATRSASNKMRDAAEDKWIDIASHISSPDQPTGPATIGDEDSDAAVEQVIQSTRSCSIDDEVMNEQDQAKPSDPPSDAELAYPAEMDQDKSSEHIYDARDDDVSMEQLGVVEGGGPPHPYTDAEVVPDSEDESEDEQVDQLCHDDDDDDDRIEPAEPAEWSQSGSITPIPLRNVVDSQSGTPQIVDLDSSSSSGDNEYTKKGLTLASPNDSSNAPLSNSVSAEGISSMDVEEFSSDTSLESLNVQEISRKRPRSPSNQVIDDVEHDAEKSRSSPAVSSASFYSTQPKKVLKTYGERNPPPIDVSPEQVLDEGENTWDKDSGEQPRTWIFSLDSLGSRHPSVFNKLNQYLHAEAKDKKGIDNPSNALTKIALVPAQPNYCDCGLYLLHFAKTFMSDPEKYKNAICSTKKFAVKERNALWLGDQVGIMREEMKARILAESEAWKKVKAEKEVDKRATSESSGPAPAMELSDDEIEVSEVQHRVVPSFTPNKDGKKAASKPGTGQTKATRIRD